jgi:nicotinate-nucleotide pyrophosphorylase (carboxylating)
MELDLERVRPLLRMAIREDVGAGDITGAAIIPQAAKAKASFVAREPLVVAGLPVAEEVFRMLSKKIAFQPLVKDGESAPPNAPIATVEGPARAILRGERLALNFLQRLSGIATITRRCVDTVKGRPATAGKPVKIMDTRKTTPCWRYLEKYAVRTGGGTNHRMGLYDQVLIKDNHLELIAAAHPEHPIRWAVEKARAAVGPDVKVEVEVETNTVEQAIEAAEAGADIIMLDNMSWTAMKKAIPAIRQTARPGGQAGKPVEIEISGRVRLDTLLAVAAAGPDCISMGMLTHSAPAVDISLEFE